jgi:hypothetical protein
VGWTNSQSINRNPVSGSGQLATLSSDPHPTYRLTSYYCVLVDGAPAAAAAAAAATAASPPTACHPLRSAAAAVVPARPCPRSPGHTAGTYIIYIDIDIDIYIYIYIYIYICIKINIYVCI